MTRVKAVAFVVFASSLALGAGPARAQGKGKTSDVVVTNIPSEAVPVTVVVNQPIQASSVGQLTGPKNFVLYVVPVGKRLVVEHFSSQVGIAAASTVNRYSLGIAEDPNVPGAVRFSHFIPPDFSSPCGTCSAGQVEVVASEAIRMYVEAGEALVVNVTFSDAVGPNAFGFFSVTGHLIDTP
jgi:hypothetical protein